MIRALLAIPALRAILYILCGTHILAFLAGKYMSRSSRVVHLHYDAKSGRESRDSRIPRVARRKTLDDRVGAFLRAILILILGYVVLSVTGTSTVARP